MPTPSLADNATARESLVDRASELPTQAVLNDPAGDVNKNFSIVRKRTGPLDVLSTTGAWVGENLVLTLKVKDLRPEHLVMEKTGTASWSQTTFLVTNVDLGSGLRLEVSYGAKYDYSDDSPHVTIWDRWKDLGYLMCPAPNDPYAHRLLQAADVVANTVTFTLPVECLPAEPDEARVNGRTLWRGTDGVALYDDSTTVDGKRPTAKPHWSPWFRLS